MSTNLRPHFLIAVVCTVAVLADAGPASAEPDQARLLIAQAPPDPATEESKEKERKSKAEKRNGKDGKGAPSDESAPADGKPERVKPERVKPTAKPFAPPPSYGSKKTPPDDGDAAEPKFKKMKPPVEPAAGSDAPPERRNGKERFETKKPPVDATEGPVTPDDRRNGKERVDDKKKPQVDPAVVPAPGDDRRFDKERVDDKKTPSSKSVPETIAPPVKTPPFEPSGKPGLDARERDGKRLAPVDKTAVPRVAPDEIRRSFTAAPKRARGIDDLKRDRKEKVVGGGKLRVIEEPDRRTIVKQDGRVFIRHDESERFRRISPDARTVRRSDGSSQTVIVRRDGVRVYDVVDRHGRLLYRYKTFPGGRTVILIDNRRYYRDERSRGRDLLLGVGVGLVIGSAIVLAEPDVRIPRDRYIVDYGSASDDDIYEALIAPPVERLDRSYSLEEIRYSRSLRDRMRRVDLETVTFDFGSWEVGPDQERALERMANGILRALERNADEIFMIEGHTDAVGTNEDNLSLSDRRAQAVAEILTTAFGVPPENLVTQGYGEEDLKVPTDGPERANRRIVVRRISPLLSQDFRDEE